MVLLQLNLLLLPQKHAARTHKCSNLLDNPVNLMHQLVMDQLTLLLVVWLAVAVLPTMAAGVAFLRHCSANTERGLEATNTLRIRSHHPESTATHCFGVASCVDRAVPSSITTKLSALVGSVVVGENHVGQSETPPKCVVFFNEQLKVSHRM